MAHTGSGRWAWSVGNWPQEVSGTNREPPTRVEPAIGHPCNGGAHGERGAERQRRVLQSLPPTHRPRSSGYPVGAGQTRNRNNSHLYSPGGRAGQELGSSCRLYGEQYTAPAPPPNQESDPTAPHPSPTTCPAFISLRPRPPPLIPGEQGYNKSTGHLNIQ